jgi:predicted SprT family Zn-dependent metalloprotease
MTDPAALAELNALAAALAAAWTPALPAPAVRLSARLTRSAGTYRPPGTITISRHFVDQYGLAATIPILRHELAHHAVHHTAGRRARPGRVRPHGPEFRAAAARLDAPRHAPAFAAPRTVHGYRCPACGWTVLRGRRLPRRRRYSCARCAPRYDDRFRLTYLGSWREAS